MAYVDLIIYPRGIECAIMVTGDIHSGGSNGHGSDEPEWSDVENVEYVRTDGSALPARVERLIRKTYARKAATALLESEH